MTRLFLIRHAATDSFQSRIAGRNLDVHLSALGRAQCQRLAQSWGQEKIVGLYSSPQLRARETAQLLGELFRQDVAIAPELDEVDYGDWTGCSFAELQGVARWRAFNSNRSCTRIPNGELMLEVQARVIGFIERLCAHHPAGTFVLVSHADVIRSALAHFLGMPLDFSLRLEVDTACSSIVAVDPNGPRVLCMNHSGGNA